MDWIAELPDRQRTSLETLLDRVNEQEEVYEKAQNASVGQIWVALAQMNERMERMDSLIRAQREVLQEMNADVEIDQKLDDRLEESLRRY